MLCLARVTTAIAIFVCGSALPMSAQAFSGGVFRYEYVNTFSTTLFPGPFNPTSANIEVPIVAEGVLTEVFEPESGGLIDFEITSLVQTGEFPGMPPLPFTIVGGSDEAPGIDPFIGRLTSLAFDPSDPTVLTSANRVAAGPFLQIIPGVGTVYSAGNYGFESTIGGLPYSPGDILNGRGLTTIDPIDGSFTLTGGDVPIFLQLGPTIDPSVDLEIGFIPAGGIVEILRVVPEPSTVCLAGLALLAAARRSKARRRA